MPKILMVSTVAGTLKAFLLPYARHFRNLGWQVDGAAAGITGDADCMAAFDSAFEVAWCRRPLAPRNFFRAPFEIRNLVAKHGYDIVHVHTPVAAFMSRCALRRFRRQGGVKIVYTAHGFFFHPLGTKLSNLFYETLEKIAGKWTDYLVVMNYWDREMAEKLQLVPRERVRYMPGIGVDTDLYNPRCVTPGEIQTLRQELHLNPDDRLLLMIAEFRPAKRHEEVLEALRLARNKRIHLAFAGCGTRQRQMVELASRLGLTSRVHFLGQRRDIPALIRASTATVLASRLEGLPRSIMESLSLGVPVIASDIRGIRELLETGGGLLVAPGDSKGLADAMDRLVEDPELVAGMAHVARRQMMAYDIKKLLAIHEQLYREALQESTVPEAIVRDREPRVSQP